MSIDYVAIKDGMRLLEPKLSNVGDDVLDAYIELAEGITSSYGYTEDDALYPTLVTYMALYYSTSNSDNTRITRKKVGDVEQDYGETKSIGNKWLDAFDRLAGIDTDSGANSSLDYSGVE